MTIPPVRIISPYITNPRFRGGTIEENVTIKDKNFNPAKSLTITIRNKVGLRPIK